VPNSNDNSVKAIKNIVFDFGKVLVDFDSVQLVRRICQDGKRQEEFIQIVENPDFIDRCDKGDESMDEITLDMQQRYPHLAEEFGQYNTRYSEEVTGEISGMRALLGKLKLQGYHLYGLTNWCSKVTEVIEKYSGLFSMLEGIVVSSEERIIKPNPEIYRHLFRKFDLKPEECVFVDDKARNIEAARELGMHGIVFVDASQLENAIVQLCEK